MNRIALFLLITTITYFVLPLAYPAANITLTQAAAITLLAFVARAVLAPESPDIYLVNGSNEEEDAE